MAAILSNSESFIFASDYLKNNKNIVYAAI